MVTSDRISRRKLVLVTVAVVVFVALIAMFFDRLLLREGVTRFDVLAISNLLTGVACGSLFYTLARHERERRERINQRLQLIAEMNHHIRNALQVITFSVFDPQGRDVSMDKIRQALDRIQWALREVLPKYSEPAPENGLVPESLETQRNTTAFPAENAHTMDPRNPAVNGEQRAV